MLLLKVVCDSMKTSAIYFGYVGLMGERVYFRVLSR